MALIISIGYSMNRTNSTNPAIDNTSSGNLSDILQLEFSPGSMLHASFSSTVTTESNSILISSENIDSSMKNLSRQEYMQGLEAGERAMKDRLSADILAAKSSLPSPSPESRHRYAVSTRPKVNALALAAVGEIAATRKIENMR